MAWDWFDFPWGSGRRQTQDGGSGQPSPVDTPPAGRAGLLRGVFGPGRQLYSDLTGTRWTVLEAKAGGMGVVYRVRDHADDVIRGMKALRPDFVSSVERRQRFLKEATIWVRLPPHPNVVTAEWVDVVEDQPVVIMEWVDSGDLESRIGRKDLRQDRALEYAIQFCDGMTFAHDQAGIIHRDVKPANCLLTSRERLKVGDFGIAAALHDFLGTITGQQSAGPAALTRPAGTEEYMAPEQRSSASPDVRADVYAFGVMLFEMLTFRLPPVRTVADLPAVDRDALAERAKTRRLPQRLIDLILACVNFESAARPADFREVRGELGAVLSGPLHLPVPPVPGSSPGTIQYWNNKGVAFQALGLYADAIAAYDEALRQSPCDPELWQNRGAALLSLDRFAEAIECFDQALIYSPKDADILCNKGFAQLKLEDPRGAVATLEAAAQLAPSDPLVCRNLAQALCETGRLQDGLYWSRHGLAVDGRNPGLIEVEGFALLALGQVDAAMESFARGLVITPGRPGLWKGRGLVHSRREELNEAIESFDRALALGGYDRTLLRHKADVLRRMGQEEEARAAEALN